VQEIVDIHGGLDILINNAGGAQQPKGSMDTLDAQDLNQLLQLNVVGAHTVTSSVVSKAMAKPEATGGGGGRILNISSKAGKVGLPNNSFYVASKFALEGMTSSWAKEFKDRNIMVCSLSPGMVDTKSFPKPAGKPGVRSPESIQDALLLALTSDMEYTGHYMHADELDLVRETGLPDERAWKPIDERPFEV
jgi:3-oxoacyl-[acyl-carrier protein] reductase